MFSITLGSFSNHPVGKKKQQENINCFRPLFLLHKENRRERSTRLPSQFMALHGGACFTREHMSEHYLGDKAITVKSLQGSVGDA